MTTTPHISVIVPISEVSADFADLSEQYLRVLNALEDTCELIYVIDIQDQAIADTVADQVKRHAFVKSVTLPRAYGDSTALKAGLRAAAGERLLVLPGYPQVEPDDVLQVVAALDHCDMAVGQRDRSGESWLNKLHGRLFNSLLSRVASSLVGDMGCEVRAFTREVAEQVWFYGDQHKFLPVLAERMGFNVQPVEVRQASANRRRGLRSPSQYLGSMLDILNVVFLTRFTKRPLRFFGLIGLGLTALGALVIVYVVIERLFFDVGLASRPALVMGALMLVVGLQILGIGLIGEIVIFSRAKDLPEYYVKEEVTGDAQADAEAGTADDSAAPEQHTENPKPKAVSGRASPI